jgi:transcriptional regulator with XRE-family HTH domain
MTTEQIGEFVKQQRISQNFTQTELAEKVGVRRQVLIEIENAQCNYGINIIMKILSALGFKLVPTIISTDIPKYERRILFDFKQISPADPANDPYLEEKKKGRIFAHTKFKKTI